MVSDHMLISILSMSVEAPEMLCAETADPLAPQARDWKPNDLINSLQLMCISKKLHLSRIQFCLSIISSGA